VRLTPLLFVLACGGKSSGGPPPLPMFSDSGLAADSGDGGAQTDDSGGSDSGSGVDFCADAPLVNWVNFGEGFLMEACQGCHASGSPDRYGAPEEIVFDTVAQAWSQADRILARAGGAVPTMPPLGGTTEDQRLKLRYWLECADSGT